MGKAVRISILATLAPLAGFVLGVSLFFAWNGLELALTPYRPSMADAAVRLVGLFGAAWLALFAAWRRRIGNPAQVLLIALFGSATAVFMWIAFVSHQRF
jgi:hypothetical protein